MSTYSKRTCRQPLRQHELQIFISPLIVNSYMFMSFTKDCNMIMNDMMNKF